jgi:hypothetical protein
MVDDNRRMKRVEVATEASKLENAPLLLLRLFQTLLRQAWSVCRRPQLRINEVQVCPQIYRF